MTDDIVSNTRFHTNKYYKKYILQDSRNLNTHIPKLVFFKPEVRLFRLSVLFETEI